MSGPATTVALLFDDSELGAQLRRALQDGGAHIVHEGEVADLDRDLLRRLDADVLVVNLDDAAGEALEDLYDLLDGDRPRVVFNDAQASRGLSGWDLARWARHLAAKVVLIDELDPPRPDGARGLEPPAMDAASSAGVAASLAHEQATFLPAPGETDVAIVPEGDENATTESLAEELEALLASGELPQEDAGEFSPGLRHAGSDELPPLHDGPFGEALPDLGRAAAAVALAEQASVAAEPPVFQIDHLQLASLPEDAGAEAIAGVPVDAAAAKKATPLQAPDSWALLDDVAEVQDVAAEVVEADRPDPLDFGIQKMSAADFLAPEGSPAPAGEEPVMSLELVSIEEAIAPQYYESTHEMVLDMDGLALRRIVLVGAAADGEKSLAAFFGALPAGIPLAFVLIQHAGDQPMEERVERLAAHSAIPVQLAEDDGRAVMGEVRVVPAGCTPRLARDGRIQLQASTDDARMSPSIDSGFTMAANVFGRDALGIVMGGRGTDAIGGAQAIHDRGGQVWAEADEDYVTDMVRGLFAERLVSFSGDAPTLAAHLVEVFS